MSVGDKPKNDLTRDYRFQISVSKVPKTPVFIYLNALNKFYAPYTYQLGN